MEEEYVNNLRYAKMMIKAYQRAYFRKNSKSPASIQLRCVSNGPKLFWRYYLQLWVNGYLKEHERITEEAYDTLSYDPSLKREEIGSLEIIVVMETERSLNKDKLVRVQAVQVTNN